ncbi:MAG: outer membrane protein assembly factor BamE [Janthinobacterium lividum]
MTLLSSKRYGVRHLTSHAAIALTAVLALAACSTYNGLSNRVIEHITPYRVTVVQGNFVSAEAAAKLTVGMSREQVRNAIGTPLLTDMFHADRWDYVFYFKRGSTSVVQQRDLVVYFNGDSLDHWTGALDLPSEQDLIAEIDGDKNETTAARQEKAKARDAATARAQDAAARNGTATAPASAAAASAPAATAQAPAAAAASSVPANVDISRRSNADLSQPSPSRTNGAPAHGIPQPVVQGGAQSPVPNAPEPQFRLRAPAGNAGQSNGDSTGSDAAGLLPNQPILAPSNSDSSNSSGSTAQ